MKITQVRYVNIDEITPDSLAMNRKENISLNK